MAEQSKEQKQTIGRVMHEWKHGELKTPAGDTVADRRQAVAIGLSEAGASNQNTSAENKRNLRRTKREEASAGMGRGRNKDQPTRADLYARAKEQGVPGRSRMSKAELEGAVG